MIESRECIRLSHRLPGFNYPAHLAAAIGAESAQDDVAGRMQLTAGVTNARAIAGATPDVSQDRFLVRIAHARPAPHRGRC